MTDHPNPEPIQDTLRRELMRLEALPITPERAAELGRLITALQALQPQAENARKWAELHKREVTS